MAPLVCGRWFELLMVVRSVICINCHNHLGDAIGLLEHILVTAAGIAQLLVGQ